MLKVDQINLIEKLPLLGLVRKGENKFKCFCPFCQKTDNSKTKKAGFFYKNGTYVFSCFKGCYSGNLINFTKTHFPTFFSNTLYEAYKHSNVGDASIIQLDDVLDVSKIRNKEFKEFTKELIQDKKLLSYNSWPIEAVQYVRERQLPENRFATMLYTNNMMEIYHKYKDEFEPGIKKTQASKVKIQTDKRIVWTFRDRNNNIVGLQGRSIEGKEPRYIILKFDENLIGNIENVELKDPVIITEGYLDSLFLKNAISCNGVSNWRHTYDTIRQLNKKTPMIFVLDNEIEDNKNLKSIMKDIVKISMHDSYLGVYMFPKGWTQYGKDINDYIKSGMDSTTLTETIVKNSVNGLKAKMDLLCLNQ